VHEYRLFFYDEAFRLTTAHEFLADSDEGAIREALGWREGRKMELWERDRKLRCWGFPDCPRDGCRMP